MKPITFHCLVLISKYISKTMYVIDQLLVVRLNYKIAVVLTTVQNYKEYYKIMRILF